MCECLAYDDGAMYLCLCCADMWREHQKLQEELAPRLDAFIKWREEIGCNHEGPPMSRQEAMEMLLKYAATLHGYTAKETP